MQGLLQLQGMLRSCDPIIVVVDLTVSRRGAGWDKELYSQAGSLPKRGTQEQEEANVTRVSSRKKKRGSVGLLESAAWRPRTVRRLPAMSECLSQTPLTPILYTFCPMK